MNSPYFVNLVARSIFGAGALKLLPTELLRLGLKKAIIITDDVLLKSGLVDQVTLLFNQSKIEYSIFSNVIPNPTTSLVYSCVDFCRQNNCDVLVAVGGGSAIDTAKATGILLTNGGKVNDYEGVNKSKIKSIPSVAINTTAGTGSEVTSFYVVTDDVKHSKMVMVDINCMITIAVNDPELMVKMPKGLTAATGMDVLTHSIEAVLSTGATPFTDKDAMWAMGAVKEYLPVAYIHPHDMVARDMMAYAEYSAGMAFSNAGLGLVHAMAHSLGGLYNLPHGVCNAILLPYVMEYDSKCKLVLPLFKKIAMALNIKGADWFTPSRAAEESISCVRKISKAVSIPNKLSTLGVKESDLPALAEFAIKDTCIASTPVKPTLEDIISIYKKSLK